MTSNFSSSVAAALFTMFFPFVSLIGLLLCSMLLYYFALSSQQRTKVQVELSTIVLNTLGTSLNIFRSVQVQWLSRLPIQVPVEEFHQEAIIDDVTGFLCIGINVPVTYMFQNLFSSLTTMERRTILLRLSLCSSSGKQSGSTSMSNSSARKCVNQGRTKRHWRYPSRYTFWDPFEGSSCPGTGTGAKDALLSLRG